LPRVAPPFCIPRHNGESFHPEALEKGAKGGVAGISQRFRPRSSFMQFACCRAHTLVQAGAMVERRSGRKGPAAKKGNLVMKRYFHLAYVLLALGSILPMLVSMTPYA
jgi:hypothetical protein